MSSYILTNKYISNNLPLPIHFKDQPYIKKKKRIERNCNRTEKKSPLEKKSVQMHSGVTILNSMEQTTERSFCMPIHFQNLMSQMTNRQEQSSEEAPRQTLLIQPKRRKTWSTMNQEPALALLLQSLFKLNNLTKFGLLKLIYLFIRKNL